MKKFYSLVAAVVLAVTVNAQATIFSADFNDVSGTGGNDGLWGGQIAGTAATAAAAVLDGCKIAALVQLSQNQTPLYP